MQERPLTEETVREALKGVRFPGFTRDILSFGIVKGVRVHEGIVSARFELITDKPETMGLIKTEAEKVIAALPGVNRVLIETKVTRPPAAPGLPPGSQGHTEGLLPGVRHAVAVASGKGGVGKSTVAVNLAVSLARMGWRTGLLDADIYGPSIPLMMGAVDAVPSRGSRGATTVEQHGVRIMSIGFFVDRDSALVWRGPMVMKAITQLLEEVEWGELDYLVVDLPPGTGDAQLTLSQAIRLSGVVIVTTPQDVALLDAAKGVAMFRKVDVPVLGIVENMAYFVCPSCGTQSDIFSHGGGAREAERLGVPFLGEIPLHGSIREGGDEGVPVVVKNPESAQSKAFGSLAKSVVTELDGDEAHPGGGEPRSLLGRIRSGFGLGS